MMLEHYRLFQLGYLLSMFGFYGLLQISYIYLVEITGNDKRVFSRVGWFTYDSLISMSFYIPRLGGGVLMALIIKYFPHFSVDILALLEFIFPLVSVILLAWLPESP